MLNQRVSVAAWHPRGHGEGVRADRECSGELRDGRDFVGDARSLGGTQLRHLGLLGVVRQQVWSVGVKPRRCSVRHAFLCGWLKGRRPSFVLPDRNKYVNMDRHFLKSYMNRVIKVCME